MILTVPRISAKATYALNWKIALLNIQGKGDANGYLGENILVTKTAIFPV